MDSIMVALSLFLSLFNGGSPSEAELDDYSSSLSECTREMSIALAECDNVSRVDSRNLCYAIASGDCFFCKRIIDSGLKENCLSQVKDL